MIPAHTTIDLETSIKNIGEDSIGDFHAAPFHPDNKIVSAGYYHYGKYTEWYYTYEFGKYIPEQGLLVGQNIKFDLLYLLKEAPQFRESLVKHCTIWDTQLAEYLLTGQEELYANLNDMSKKYGGTQKRDAIKEDYWNNGIDTEDIPKEELLEYMKHDVLNTDLVFEQQYAKAVELGMLPLIESQMEALLATTEMEYNGMWFDKQLAHEYIVPLRAEMAPIEEEIVQLLSDALPNFGTKLEPYSAGSGDQISLYLFGGEYKGRENLPMYEEFKEDHKDMFDTMADPRQPVLIKSGPNKGKVRHKYVYSKYNTDGLCTPDEKWGLNKEGMFQVDDKVLKTCGNRFKDARIKKFTDLVRRYRDLNKELSTYLVGYSVLAWPVQGGAILHGKFNHASTGTGRLSSTKPNLQNASGKGE